MQRVIRLPAARLAKRSLTPAASRSFSLGIETGDTSRHVQFREPDPSKPKLVLAYSGGLDTSTQLSWLAKEKGFEVVAFIADVGQDDVKDQKEIDAICEKAKLSGAYSFYCADLRKPFIEDYVFPCIQSNAIYEGRYLLGTSMARPCIAEAQINVLRKEGATHISHGSTGKGNDQVRFEVCYLGMEPTVDCVTMWRDDEYLSLFEGRQDLIDYATKHGIPVGATKSASYSEDENIMHISYESGELEDPNCPPQEKMFKKTTAIVDCPDTPCNLTIDFEGGLPVKVVNDDDGTTYTDSLELFAYLNQVGGEHGCGRIDIVENRFVGMKSRGCYETPGGTILYAAHLDLETLTLDREVMRIRDGLSIKFAELVYNGYWFSPEMEFLKPAMLQCQDVVTGTVKLQLIKGNIIMRGRSSPLSLYDQDLVSMDIEGGFKPQNSTGFINTLSTRIKASAARDKKK